MKTHPSKEDQVRMVHLYAMGMQVEDSLNQGLLDNGEVSHKVVETSTNINNDSGINMVRSHHKHKREFVPLGMKLEDVFHILEAIGDLKPLQPKFPSNLAQKGGEYCKYHQVTGHSIEQCGALKNTVQDLIDQGKVDPTKLDD
ncbi:hypothetical protein RHSIM_Rhsim01G0144400 [Rhododendron simsii]|uniref:Uncharacterized protein n=1 Tax=Rhododendron simsii TaxID=118357 RepID=A0A834LXH4_RHOSS|nr:hypothetical protein RHSIM_Rhsim01G0144400 [Rhododendron simsii]